MLIRAKFVLNVYFIVQKGRLAYECLMALASLRCASPNFAGRVYVIEPQPGPLWPDDPRVTGPLRDMLMRLCDDWVPLHNEIFGAQYPHGNKIEALRLLPKAEPFIFFDSDTLFYRNLNDLNVDYTRPSASNLCTNTWPKLQPNGASLAQIWQSLYARFDLDFLSAQNTGYAADDWRRYPYYNAGWFYGDCPSEFGALYATMAQDIWHNSPIQLTGQNLYPWLDQVVLPLVIHALKGGAVADAPLDQDFTYHYRYLARAFAHAPLPARRALHVTTRQPHLAELFKQYDPFYPFLYGNSGAEAQSIGQAIKRGDETVLRNRLQQAGLWVR